MFSLYTNAKSSAYKKEQEKMKQIVKASLQESLNRYIENHKGRQEKIIK